VTIPSDLLPAKNNGASCEEKHKHETYPRMISQLDGVHGFVLSLETKKIDAWNRLIAVAYSIDKYHEATGGCECSLLSSTIQASITASRLSFDVGQQVKLTGLTFALSEWAFTKTR